MLGTNAHAICCLLVSKTDAHVYIETKTVVVNNINKTRAYPVVRHGMTFLCSVHSINQTDEDRVQFASDMCEKVIDKICEDHDGVENIIIFADTNAPVDSVTPLLRRRYLNINMSTSP